MISAKEVFLAVGEEISLTPCTSEDAAIDGCVRSENCIMEGVWSDATDHINSYFENLSLQNIIDKYGDKS